MTMWSGNTFVVVEIEPNPNLTDSQKDCVSADFGMFDGRLSKTIRRALVSYFVRHLRIDEPNDAQPIVWANRNQFEVFAAREKTSKGEANA